MKDVDAHSLRHSFHTLGTMHSDQTSRDRQSNLFLHEHAERISLRAENGKIL